MKAHLFKLTESSKTYTLAVARAMPDSKFDIRPVTGMWSFQELLCHLAYGIEWSIPNYIKGKKTEWAEPEQKKNKIETIKYLEFAFGSLRSAIEEENDGIEMIWGFFAILDHISHHRGQATIHLRSQGITPPEYKY